MAVTAERLKALGYTEPKPRPSKVAVTPDRLRALGFPVAEQPLQEQASPSSMPTEQQLYEQELQKQLQARAGGLMDYLPGPLKDVASAAAGYASDMAGIGLRASAAVQNVAESVLPDSRPKWMRPGMGMIDQGPRKQLDLANKLQQTSEAFDQAVNKARGDGVLGWARRMGSGALRSGANMLTGALAGGTPGAIALAGATEASQKYGELEQAGKSEAEQLGWATAAGVWESTVGFLLNKILPGNEKLLGDALKGEMKQLWKMPLKEAAKEVFKEQRNAQVDEQITELGHLGMRYADGTTKYVSPEETMMDIFRTMRDTAMQAFLMTGGVQAGTQAAARAAEKRQGETPFGQTPPPATPPQRPQPSQRANLNPPTTPRPIPREELEAIRAKRAKGYSVSVPEGQELGLTTEQMKNRESRNAAVDQLISKAQEQQNAGTISPNQRVSEEAGQVGQGGQVDSGGNVYQSGQVEGGAKPAGEVTPAQEVQVAPKAVDIGGMGAGIADAMYDAWDKSIKETGSLPPQEKASIPGQAWEKILARGYTAEEAREKFVQAGRNQGWSDAKTAKETMSQFPPKESPTPVEAPQTDIQRAMEEEVRKALAPKPVKEQGRKPSKEAEALAERAAKGEQVERPVDVSEARWKAMVAQKAKRLGKKAPTESKVEVPKPPKRAPRKPKVQTVSQAVEAIASRPEQEVRGTVAEAKSEAARIADKLVAWKGTERLTDPENFAGSWMGYDEAQQKAVVDELVARGELPISFSRIKTGKKSRGYLTSQELLQGLTGKNAADKFKKPTRQPSERTKAKKAALDKAAKEFRDAAKNELGGTLPGAVNARLVKAAGSLIKAAVEYKYSQFKDFVDYVVKLVGEKKTVQLADYLEAAWAALRTNEGFTHLDEPSSIKDMLKKPVKKPAPKAAPAPKSNWQDSVLSALSGKTKVADAVTLPELWAQIEKANPGLTMEEFKQGLLKLHTDGKIRLEDATGEWATIINNPLAIRGKDFDEKRGYGLKWWVRGVEGAKPVESPVKNPVPPPGKEAPPEPVRETPVEQEQRVAEVPLEQREVFGLKKAVIKELREAVGLDSLDEVQPEKVQEWADEAAATLAQDPLAGIRLVNELSTNPRAVDEREYTLLAFRYVQLANELKPFQDEYNKAVASGDPLAISTARTGLLNARSAMTQFEETIRPRTTSWGRSGVAIQQLFRRDYSLEAILRRGQEANHGKDLDADQINELTKLAEEFADLQKKYAAEQKRTAELEAELASKRQHEEVVKNAPGRGRKEAETTRQRTRRQVSEAVSSFKSAWNEAVKAAGGKFFTSGGLNPEAIGAAGKAAKAAVGVVKAYIEMGVVTFTELMGNLRAQFGDKAAEMRSTFHVAWQTVMQEQQIAPPIVDMEDPAGLTAEARRIQRGLVEAGMTDREEVIDAVWEALQEFIPDLNRRQTMDALSAYGQFSLPSEETITKAISQMNAEILKRSQIDQLGMAIKRAEELRSQGRSDEEIGDILAEEDLLVKATGFQRRPPHDVLRDLTQQYNDLKKEVPPTTAKMAGTLQSAQDAVVRALVNRISDLNRAIETKTPITRSGKVLTDTEAVGALKEERDRLLKIYRDIFPPEHKKLTEEQRVNMAMKAADRAIAELERQLDTGDVAPKEPNRVTSPALELKRARLAQLRAARDALRAATMPELKEQATIKAHEAGLRKRIADYQAILDSGDFAPKAKKPTRVQTPGELALKRQLEDKRHQVLQKYAEYHLANLGGIAWTADKIAETAHLSRALMTSFDLSAVLRQGGLVAMGHPAMASKALYDSLAAIVKSYNPENAKALAGGVTKENLKKFLKTIDSRQAEFDFMEKLNSGPQGEFRNQAGLNLPTSDEVITKQEEAFQGRWGKLVPGVALSSRQYTMVLNRIRADLFDLMVQNLGRNGQVTLEEGKLIADFVNVATGRSAALKIKGVDVTAALNLGFFAPRYVASRFQYLAMPFYLPFKGGLKQNWRVKRAIYKEMGRTATGIGVTLGAVALLASMMYDDDDEDKPRIELDPRSADFLKIRWGETRIDLLAGLQQVMVLSARMAPSWMGGGAIKSSVTGEVKTLGEDANSKTRLDVLGQFIRTKMAPVPSAGVTIADDWTNVVGQKETPLSLAVNMVAPMSISGISDTMKMQGYTKGSALGLLSVLGAGMNTYGPKTQYVTGTPEQRQEQFDKDLKKMQWDSPAPAYSEFLTTEQVKQVAKRRELKAGELIMDAVADSPDEQVAEAKKKRKVAYKDAESLQKAQEAFQKKQESFAALNGKMSLDDAEKALALRYIEAKPDKLDADGKVIPKPEPTRDATGSWKPFGKISENVDFRVRRDRLRKAYGK